MVPHRELVQVLFERLEAFVESKGLKRSDTRKKILETIVMEAKHFRAQDLLEWLQKHFPEVGKATLYRNLPILVESGIIQEGPTDPEGQTLYELSELSHHDHIVCLDCKHIFEFHDEVIEERQEAASSKQGFSVRSHRHVIYAACDYLARRKPAKKPRN